MATDFDVDLSGGLGVGITALPRIVVGVDQLPKILVGLDELGLRVKELPKVQVGVTELPPVKVGITELPEVKVGITQLPKIELGIDPLELRLTEFPSIRAHLPADFHVGVSFLGHELVGVRLCGEAQVITEPYVPNPCERCEPPDALSEPDR